MKKLIKTHSLILIMGSLFFTSGSALAGIKDEISDLQNQIDTIELTPGPQGEKGDQGDTGDTGLTGAKGDTGDTGLTGAKGDAGGIVQYKAALPIAINGIQRLTIDATGGMYTLEIGGSVPSADLNFDASVSAIALEIQVLVESEYSVTGGNDVKVTQEGVGLYHITFVDELADVTIDLLTVDSTNLTGGTGGDGMGGTIDVSEEIGLTEGVNMGDLLEWNGSNWMAKAPRLVNIPSHTNMQPSLGMHYAIALVGQFPSRSAADPFIGEIMLVGFNFPPRGWAFCEGQLLPIVQYQALFSLLGSTYGGDGRTTFGLPDLRGRVPVGVGSGAGLSNRNWGQRFGEETTNAINR